MTRVGSVFISIPPSYILSLSFPFLHFFLSSFLPFFRSRGNRFGTPSNPPHRISINPLYSSRSSPSVSLRSSSVRAYFQFSRYIRPLAIEDKTFSSLSVGLPVCLACSLPVLWMTVPLHALSLSLFLVTCEYVHAHLYVYAWTRKVTCSRWCRGEETSLVTLILRYPKNLVPRRSTRIDGIYQFLPRSFQPSSDGIFLRISFRKKF